MDAMRKLHSKLIVSGLHRDPFSISQVLIAYSQSPTHLDLSIVVFNQTEKPNTFIFNTLIRGFSQSHEPRRSIFFYDLMLERGLSQDNRTFPSVLKACARSQALTEGRKIHSHSLRLGFVSDLFVSNALIHFYAVLGDFFSARLAFDEMPVRDLVSWNALLCGCSQFNSLTEVLLLFEKMLSTEVGANEVTMVKVLQACMRLGDQEIAKVAINYIQLNAIKVDVYLGNTLIDFYGRLGLVDKAQKVFDEMDEKNTVTLNALISTYAKAGDMVSAQRVFDGMGERDLISWSSMITGYSQASRFSDALELFQNMVVTQNIKPDEILMACVISACARLGSLTLGEWIHGFIKRNYVKEDIFVGNALIDMYSRCGNVKRAIHVFGKMEERDALSWNLIILGQANNGRVGTALRFFSDMLSQGFQPNEGTFLAVLIACAHGGLVEEGIGYFEGMKAIYGIEPETRHYGCMVDILGRSGNLERAMEFVKNIPVTPDSFVWRILLASCKVHGNVVMAEYATQRIIEQDPCNSGNYVLLSNSYADVSKWREAKRMRDAMLDADVWKIPGWSFMEIDSGGRRKVVN